MAQKRKTKIIHVIPTLQFGGAERLVVEIARRYDHTQFDLSVVTVVTGGPLVAALQKTRVPYHAIEKRGALGVNVVWQLYRLFRSEKPDVVHTHLFGADVWGKIAARLAGVPVIVSTEHNMWYDESAFKHRVKSWVARLSTRIIAISRAVATYMMETEQVPNKKITIIHNGVDVDAFASLPIAEPRPGMPVRFLAIGRLERQKGFDVLLAACAQLADAPWSLTIVGAGSQLHALQSLAEKLGIAAKVQFYGTTDAVADVFALHDVFVLSSRWEGLGLVVMEAMVAGRAVVATRVGGVPEILEEGKNGMLVDAEDPSALAAAMRAYIEHPDRVAPEGERARAYARLHCGIDQMVRAYEALYLQLLSA